MYLNKDAAGVGARHSMHGIKREAEVWLAQQRLQGIKVENGAQQLQVILYWVDHLQHCIALQTCSSMACLGAHGAWCRCLSKSHCNTAALQAARVCS